MIINRDNFTEMTILPFGVHDWATDRQYRQLHYLLDTVASLLSLPPKSDCLDGTARAVMDMFGTLFASYEPDAGIDSSVIVREPTVTENFESYDPANTKIIALDLKNPKRATGDAALTGVPERWARSPAPASRRRRPVLQSRR